MAAKKKPRAFRPPPVPGLDAEKRVREANGRALDAIIAKRPLDPPGRKAKP